MLMSDVDAVVRAFLLTDEADSTSYQPIGGEGAELDGVEVLPGLLYRYLQTDPNNLAVALQVFAGVGEIGAQLWEQEVRVLLRVASLQHPALPEVLNGGHIDADRIAARLDGGHRHCPCRKPRPRHATRRYSLIMPPTRACLRTRYWSRSACWGGGFSGG